MQYLLMVVADETKASLPPAELSKLMQAYRAFGEDIARSGHLRGGAPLMPSSMATTVREADGQRVVTDGPFSVTNEHIAGYYLVECTHLDEAIAIAARVPGVRLGEAVEVRPVVPVPT